MSSSRAVSPYRQAGAAEVVEASPPHQRRTTTCAEKAFAELRRDILARRLEPGSRLRPEELRSAYGIGLTPLREALSRLSSDELVVGEARRGFRVARLDCRELGELCHLRILIDGEALQRSLKSGDLAWEGAVVAAMYHLAQRGKRFAGGDLAAADGWEGDCRTFHDTLVGAAGSARLLRLRSQLIDHFTRYSSDLPGTLPSPEAMREQHVMMEAALARRGDDLAAMMAKYVSAALDRLRRSYRAPEKVRPATRKHRRLAISTP